MTLDLPLCIAVVDVGYTNTKIILYDASLRILGERKIASFHRQGNHYREIDLAPALEFIRSALIELDAHYPIDAIVPSAHGACVAALKADGSLAVPLMDYMSEPPADIISAYRKVMPAYDESYCPELPMSLLHGMQLFWQKRALPKAFAETKTILPLMQYVAYKLGGRAVTEVSSMSCQSHLVDMRTGDPSSLAQREGWDKNYAPEAKAWETVGTFKGLRGRGAILAGVHDSNANFLRYLASGISDFTLLSTGTWIIGFDTQSAITDVDITKDIVANKSVFGRTVFCCRFFGGKEYEILTAPAGTAAPSLAVTKQLVERHTMALPSFTDSGGPAPGTGGKGKIVGPPPSTLDEHASLAALYCAQMSSLSLDALASRNAIIVDGPFSQNNVYLAALAALRPGQDVYASTLTDGTAAGAACLALMPDGKLPHIATDLRKIAPTSFDLAAYHVRWKEHLPNP
jgi:sugar (pentulose or hexulose) kinase